jgi:hypothetical protein
MTCTETLKIISDVTNYLRVVKSRRGDPGISYFQGIPEGSQPYSEQTLITIFTNFATTPYFSTSYSLNTSILVSFVQTTGVSREFLCKRKDGSAVSALFAIVEIKQQKGRPSDGWAKCIKSIFVFRKVRVLCRTRKFALSSVLLIFSCQHHDFLVILEN